MCIASAGMETSGNSSGFFLQINFARISVRKDDFGVSLIFFLRFCFFLFEKLEFVVKIPNFFYYKFARRKLIIKLRSEVSLLTFCKSPECPTMAPGIKK